MYPVTELFDVYALLGYGAVSFDYTSMFEDDQDVYNYTANENLHVLAKTNIDVTIESWNFGITYSF